MKPKIDGVIRFLGLVVLMARVAYIEAIRQKFVAAVGIVTVLFVGSTLYLGDLDLGASKARFVIDIGFGILALFGSLLAIMATAQSFFGELENRTALTILAKPVPRSAFLLGKFAGVAALAATYAGVIGLATVALLTWASPAEAEVTPSTIGLLVAVIVFWLRLVILVAITLFIASFARSSLFTALASLCAFVICQLHYLAADGWAGVDSGLGRFIAWLIARLFPNFQVFDVANTLVFGGFRELGGGSLLGLAAYALGYTAVYLGLASCLFSRREI